MSLLILFFPGRLGRGGGRGAADAREPACSPRRRALGFGKKVPAKKPGPPEKKRTGQRIRGA
eukprot:8828993-Pyramimonas_sp.AAC.1